MFDHLLESSYRDDFNKWINMGLSEEITPVVLIEMNFTRLIWSTALLLTSSISSFVCAADRQNLARVFVIGVAGKPTTTTPSPRAKHSRLNAL